MKIGRGTRPDLLGSRFFNLVVKEKTDKRMTGSVVWKCVCDCGYPNPLVRGRIVGSRPSG